MKESKVLIIGAGAAGLSAAIYLSRANIPFIILEKSAPGGKLINIATIENYPGLPSLSGFEVAQELINSATRFGVNIEYGDISSVTKQEDGRFHSFTRTNEEIVTDVVVVATGLSNVPSIKGEKEHLHRGVSYCATCDGPLYRNKEIAMYGDGDRAISEAIYLLGQAKMLYVLSDKKELEGPDTLKEVVLKAKNAKFIGESQVIRINGENNVTSITYLKDGVEHELEVSAFFPFNGERSASGFLSSLDVKMEKGFLVADDTMATSCPGLYAIGDIVSKKVRQVVTAAADGATCSYSIVEYLRRKR